jgi:hypothetical protein
MILGMSTSTFTLVHVILSLIGIFTGLVVLFAMFGSKTASGWTALFLATTVLTSVTGFFFPRDQLLPSHIVGIISLVVLAVAIFAFYVRHLAGPWRWIYVAGAVLALYLNVFVGVVQAFQKAAFLKAAGADAVRAAVHHRAARRIRALRGARHRGRESLSPSDQGGRLECGLNASRGPRSGRSPIPSA